MYQAMKLGDKRTESSDKLELTFSKGWKINQNLLSVCVIKEGISN